MAIKSFLINEITFFDMSNVLMTDETGGLGGLFFKSYCLFETMAQWFKNCKLTKLN